MNLARIFIIAKFVPNSKHKIETQNTFDNDDGLWMDGLIDWESFWKFALNQHSNSLPSSKKERLQDEEKNNNKENVWRQSNKGGKIPSVSSRKLDWKSLKIF